MWSSLRALFRKTMCLRGQHERDLDDEITFHLAQETQLRAERGATPNEAHLGARRAFGSVALAREKTRAVWVSTALEQLVQDLRFGCRILTKSPALSATAVILIALVIGGNTTVFSIAHGILRKPAEGVNAQGLVTLNWIDDRSHYAEPDTSYRLYKDLAQHASTLRPMLAFQGFRRFTLNHENGSHAVHGMLVSGNYFEALEVRFARGRSFTQKEAETPDPALMIVISDHAWETHFQRAEDVIGKAVMLSGHPVTIIGVAAPRFRGTLLGQSADVWLPLASYARATGQQQSLLDGSESWVGVCGRLARGTSIARANAEMTAIWSSLQATEPELKHLRVTLVPYSLTAGSGTGIAHRGERMLAIFSIVTAMTLLIVCANVANLLIARGVIRQREMALRQSLGASRVRVIRALLAEGLVLSLAAWLAACLFAWWNSRAVRRYFITTMEGTSVVWPDFTPSWTVIGYALVLAVLCTVACTIAPAIRAWRQQLLHSLKAGEQAVIQGKSKLSSGLVVVQLAFSVLLVTSAGLAYRSLFLIDNFDSGFDTRRLLLVTVNTAGSAGNPGANESLLELLREELRGVAGVEHVTYARNSLQQRWHTNVSGVGSTTESVDAERNHVGPDYFQVLGVPLMAGRTLAPEDNSRAGRSAVISQSLARTLWPGQSPLGRTVLVEKQEAEVIGVVPDRSFSGFRRQPRGFVFLSAQQDPAAPGEATFYIRYSGGLDTIGPAVGRRFRQVDARAPIVSMNTWDSQLAGFTWPVRVLTTLLMLFAGGSLFIAVVGQYAVVSFDMRRRVRELGLRMAHGASASQVMRSVLKEGFRLTIIGLAIGFALSLATGRVLGGVLYGITPTDPLTYAGVFVLLSIASVLACYLPSRRASRINPMVALRNE